MEFNESSISSKKQDTISCLVNDIKLFSNNRQLVCNLQSSVNLCNILIAISSDTIDKLLTDNSIKNAPIIPANLKKAINYIAQHYSEQITLDNLAERSIELLNAPEELKKMKDALENYNQLIGTEGIFNNLTVQK